MDSTGKLVEYDQGSEYTEDRKCEWDMADKLSSMRMEWNISKRTKNEYRIKYKWKLDMSKF